MILGLATLFALIAVSLPLVYYMVTHDAPASERSWKEVLVRVRGGRFDPETIHGRVGQRLRISFARADDSSCAERIVFPDLGWSAALPQDREVALDLAPEQPGVHEFTCGLGVLRGRLVVDPFQATRGRISGLPRWGRRPATDGGGRAGVEDSVHRNRARKEKER